MRPFRTGGCGDYKHIVPFTWILTVPTNDELFPLEPVSKTDPLVLRASLGGQGASGEVDLVACCEVATSTRGGDFWVR